VVEVNDKYGVWLERTLIHDEDESENDDNEYVYETRRDETIR
jgi:hypothetical protein